MAERYGINVTLCPDGKLTEALVIPHVQKFVNAIARIVLQEVTGPLCEPLQLRLADKKRIQALDVRDVDTPGYTPRIITDLPTIIGARLFTKAVDQDSLRITDILSSD